jgi:hypothetical protein
LGLQLFQNVPKYISDVFTSIWGSIATGSAGIGLVIVKYLRQVHFNHPNYFAYTMTTTVIFIMLVAGLQSLIQPIDDGSTIQPPAEATLISLDAGLQNKEISFELSPPIAGQQATYAMKGFYMIVNNKLKGHVEPIRFTTTSQFNPQFPMHLTRASIQICYIHILGGIPGRPDLNGKWGMQSYPMTKKSYNSSPDFDVVLTPSSTISIPEFNFEIEMPKDLKSDRAWLCGAIYQEGDAYWPAS